MSIFFLPLAFTTSIFSINNELFNPLTLPWIAAIVGIVTYLIVFNLNTIVRVLRVAYSKPREETIKKMKKSKVEEWQARGKEFDKFNFRSKTEGAKPSEWFVGWYLFTRMGQVFRKRRPCEAEGETKDITERDPRRTQEHESEDANNVNTDVNVNAIGVERVVSPEEIKCR